MFERSTQSRHHMHHIPTVTCKSTTVCLSRKSFQFQQSPHTYETQDTFHYVLIILKAQCGGKGPRGSRNEALRPRGSRNEALRPRGSRNGAHIIYMQTVSRAEVEGEGVLRGCQGGVETGPKWSGGALEDWTDNRVGENLVRKESR